MAIRYDSQLNAELRRAIRSFNAKLKRLENKGVSAALLPDKLSTKELKQGILNRRDLRERIGQLSEFSSAGTVSESEGGLLGTDILFQYRQGEANRAIKEINKEYEKTLKLDTRYPMMQGEYVNTLKSKMDYLSRDIRKMDIRQVQIFNKNLITPEKKTLMDEKFYNNYIKMIFFDAYKGAIPPELIRSITELVEKLPPNKLLELYNTDPAIRGIKDLYIRGKMESGEMSEDEYRLTMESTQARLTEEVAKLAN